MAKIKAEKTANSVSNKIRFNSFIAYLLFLIIGFTVYSKVISFGLVEFDDKRIIENSLKLNDDDILHNIFDLDPYFSTNTTFYRPIQNLSILIDNKFNYEKYKSYHLTNLILHIVVVSLIYYLLVQFGYNIKYSFLFGAIFLVHPLFSFNVAWIPARGDLLVAMFSLLTLIFFNKYNKKNTIIDIILSSIFLLFAILSKEIALVFPIILLMYFIAFNDKKIHEDGRFTASKFSIIYIVFSWVLPITIYFILKPNNQFSILDNFGFWEFINNLNYYPAYIQKLFLPVNLSGMSQFGDINYLGYLFLAFIGIILYFQRKIIDFKKIVFYFSWFIILMIPLIAFKQTFVHTMEYWEHRAYLPVIGIFFLCIEIINQIKISRKIKEVSLLILCLILAVFSYNKSLSYSNAYYFYDNIIQNKNELPNAYFGRGVALFNQGKIKESIEDFDKSIQLNPIYPESIFKRAVAKYKLKDSEGAINDFKKVIEIKQDFIEAYENIGNIHYFIGDKQKSLEYFNLGLKIDPNNKKIQDKLMKFKF